MYQLVEAETPGLSVLPPSGAHVLEAASAAAKATRVAVTAMVTVYLRLQAHHLPLGADELM
jgi:hypothetical protein